MLTMGAPALILASTSPHRRALLARLKIPFAIAAPKADESVVEGEPPEARAIRLAEDKARGAPSKLWRGKNAVIVGGDQTIAAEDSGELFHKPGGGEREIVAQLMRMRGRALWFYTAAAVFNPARRRLRWQLARHRAVMRRASAAEIRRYARAEPSPNCAGGAQLEGLGISLLSQIHGGDPTALIGAPMLLIAQMLREEGFKIP